MNTDNQFSLRHVVIAVIGGFALSAIVLLGILVKIGLLKSLFGSHPIGDQTDTPIVVQGGSMTFRTTSFNGGFNPTSNGTYCVFLGPQNSSLLLEVTQLGNEPVVSESVSQGGQIDLFGHLRSQGSESSNGVEVAVVNGTCNSHDGLIAILTPEPAANGATGSDFYAYRNNGSDDDGTRIERFKDTMCTNAPDAQGDEDSCERLSNIYINPQQTSQPKTGIRIPCTDGACEVDFAVTSPIAARNKH